MVFLRYRGLRLFQFALPRGERPTDSMPSSPSWGFNSRSREGSDCSSVAVASLRRRFNSRSREGSDSSVRVCLVALAGFNSRSREGSDRRQMRCGRHSRSFNSRSREGSDFGRISPALTKRRFNSRSREGSDHLATRIGARTQNVSIRAPARGATGSRVW